MLRGLDEFRGSVHYKNCLMLKIRFNFVILCVMLTTVIFMSPYLNTEWIFGIFILLKFVGYHTLYRKVKYSDDGRELVSLVDFVTIHVTFPVMNAWLSYQTLLQGTFIFPEVYELFYLLLTVETCINLAYYNDIIHGLSLVLILTSIFKET